MRDADTEQFRLRDLDDRWNLQRGSADLATKARQPRPARPRVDTESVRSAHRIEDVIAASGVELKPAGGSWMARCPFHAEDNTPSMSVGGVAGRYHCFGCGVGGDVIDYVARFNNVGFLEAVERLTARTPFGRRVPIAVPIVARRDTPRLDRTPAGRVFEVNELAWRYFTSRSNVATAEEYMLAERGIAIRAIRSETDGRPLVGYAPTAWRGLADSLLRSGVTADELVDSDLATRRESRLIDTLRGRVVAPVRDARGRIEGFIGRDITGDPRAPKYRNPTRTATFDKARALYRPTRHPLNAAAHAIVVEGFIDALAVSAAAVQEERLSEIAPCTTSGVAVSRVQAFKTAAITKHPVLIAMDGDDAGAKGTVLWLDAMSTIGSEAVPIYLPRGSDPAEWLAQHGTAGLDILLGGAATHSAASSSITSGTSRQGMSGTQVSP